MQMKLKIALAAAGFALATNPAFAVEMPTDGSKNFSTPADAPSYFTNETVPESARVANPATFTSEDVAAAPDVAVATEPETRGKHTSAHKSTRHASGKSKGHGGPTRYAKSTSSKATGTAALHSTAKTTTGGSRSASTTKATTTAGTTSKAGPTKHARTSSRQHVEAIPVGASPLAPA